MEKENFNPKYNNTYFLIIIPKTNNKSKWIYNFQFIFSLHLYIRRNIFLKIIYITQFIIKIPNMMSC